jgi:hypothetical protein
VGKCSKQSATKGKQTLWILVKIQLNEILYRQWLAIYWVLASLLHVWDDVPDRMWEEVLSIIEWTASEKSMNFFFH